MAIQTDMTATCVCSFGTAPGVLTVTNNQTVFACGPLASTVMDTTFTPFGLCVTLTNPMVAAATAAANGVLTPQPCVPAPVPPWVPGAPTVLIAGKPALNNTSKLMCAYAGVIQVTMPVANTVTIP